MITEQIKMHVARALLIIMSLGVLIEAGFPSTIPENSIPYLDKILHFLVYGTIAYLSAYLQLQNGRKLTFNNIVVSVMFIVVLGIVVEFIQSYTPGRDASITDIIADITGACFFLGMLHIQIIRQSKFNP